MRKLGYSVSSTTGMSRGEREALLQSAIETGVLSKSYIISYLTHMIKINGKKKANEYALIKWQSDLDFVLKLK